MPQTPADIPGQLITAIDALKAHAKRGGTWNWIEEKDRLSGLIFALAKTLNLTISLEDLLARWEPMFGGRERDRLIHRWRAILGTLRSAATTLQSVSQQLTARGRPSEAWRNALLYELWKRKAPFRSQKDVADWYCTRVDPEAKPVTIKRAIQLEAQKRGGAKT